MASARRENLLLTLEVSRRHHLDGWSNVRIAERFGLSRFQVARMLARARENGWVRIEIDAPPEIDAELGDRVRAALGLRHVVVVRADRYGATTRGEVAGATAQLLQAVLTPDDVVGLAWSRTVSAAVDRLGEVPRVPVVQLTGALSRADDAGSSVELVRRFAATSGGPAYLYYAPMILADEEAARSLRAQPEVARTIDLLPQVSVAVVAVGAWAEGSSTVYDALPPADRAAAARRGVVAEISGILVDAEGTPRPEVGRRILCPRAAELRAVAHVLAAMPGEHRAGSVRAAAASGLVDSLLITQTTAEDLLGGPA